MRLPGSVAFIALTTLEALSPMRATGCRAVSPDKSIQPSDVEIRYSVNVARPPLQFSLHLPPAPNAHRASLLLATPLDPNDKTGADTLGYFTVTLSEPRRSALGLWVLQNGLLSGDRGDVATAEGSGSIEVRAGGRVATLGLAGNDAVVDKLHAMLDPIVRDADRKPERAMHLNVGLHREGAVINPVITLSSVGTLPVDIVVFDPSDASMWARIGVTVSAPRGGKPQTVGLSQMNITNLADAGKLPKGVTSVPPGVSYSCLLSNVEAPPAGEEVTLTATAIVWIAGAGGDSKARTPLTLTATTQLPSP